MTRAVTCVTIAAVIAAAGPGAVIQLHQCCSGGPLVCPWLGVANLKQVGKETVNTG